MDGNLPDAILVAGPNGAGKTTFVDLVLALHFTEASFLNADEIQREHPRFGHRVAAGRELLHRMADLERRRMSFAVESTLSSMMDASKIRDWSACGYRTILYFFELPSADFAVRRVAMRVAAGGRSVPEADVRRRFERGRRLFETVDKPLPDSWYHWRSDDGGMRFVERAQNRPGRR